MDGVKVSTKDLAFRSFEVCETRLCYQDQSVMVLCVYRLRPSRKNKLSNKMFLVGDINSHFDSDSDVSVADLKKQNKQKTVAQS